MLSRREVQRCLWLLSATACFAGGCAAVPDVIERPTYRNPFPQLHRIAVVPFYNQSREPTVDGEAVALAYAAELQMIPGFEIMPVGVAKRAMETIRFEPRTGEDFQRLARLLGVDAVIVGSITDYTPYYPPRMSLTTDWYAANPGFHPIPVGYGLPWGTAEEEYIPERLVEEAEFELAREQLATQTPEQPIDPPAAPRTSERQSPVQRAANETNTAPEELPQGVPEPHRLASPAAQSLDGSLPPDWPDPRGFVPEQPAAMRPQPRRQLKPVMTHTRLYNGKDSDFTEQLANYYYHQDDARFGGWQGYLQRPDDFLRFCCHLHLTETLAARGGAGKSRVTVRWPIGRYER